MAVISGLCYFCQMCVEKNTLTVKMFIDCRVLLGEIFRKTIYVMCEECGTAPVMLAAYEFSLKYI